MRRILIIAALAVFLATGFASAQLLTTGVGPGGFGAGIPVISYLLNNTNGRLTDNTGNPLLSN